MAFARSAVRAMQGARRNLEQHEATADLYRGPFLVDLSLRDGAAFEEWALLMREQFSRQALGVLHRLAECREQLGECERALAYARRQLELEPWDEKAQRQAMRLLALDGQRRETGL